MNPFVDQIVQKWEEVGIIKRQGPEYPDGFKLKSGITSDIYVNIRDLIKFPPLFNFTMFALGQLISTDYRCTAPPSVLGIPTMGAVMSSIIAYKKAWHLSVIRQNKKDHGIGNSIEGTLSNNILLLDDVITSGLSIQETIRDYIVPRFGDDYKLSVFVLVDRRVHVTKGLDVTALITMDEIRRYGKQQ
jgi:orotate phosphoribosyltransferase